MHHKPNYTIPRNNRELQPAKSFRPLFRIIPYQEIIGNYSLSPNTVSIISIIPYQEIIGNYSVVLQLLPWNFIIPYQEIIGNYS